LLKGSIPSIPAIIIILGCVFSQMTKKLINKNIKEIKIDLEKQPQIKNNAVIFLKERKLIKQTDYFLF